MSSLLLMTIDTGNRTDAELAVDGGILELEEEDDKSLSSPLLLRGGGDGLDGGIAAAEQPPSSSDMENSSLLVPETIIEQTVQPDGSISIKASTISPHPNGFRDVKIEHYAVPSFEAASIDTSLGSPPPGSEYLTRVEYHVLSPGFELEQPADDDDASTVYTVPVAQHGDGASVASTGTYRRRKRRRKRNYWTLILISVVAIFFIVIVGVAVTRDYTHYHGTAVNPYPDNRPSPSAPASDPDASPKRKPEKFDRHHHHKHRHAHEDKNGTSPDDGPGYNSTALS